MSKRSPGMPLPLDEADDDGPPLPDAQSDRVFRELLESFKSDRRIQIVQAAFTASLFAALAVSFLVITRLGRLAPGVSRWVLIFAWMALWLVACVLLFRALVRLNTRLMRRHLWRATPFRCDACGYNLTGNVTGTCPECGHRKGSDVQR